MIESKLTAKGQTTIPKSVRIKLNLSEGDRIKYEFDEVGVRLIRLKSVRRMAGALRYEGKPKTLADMESGVIAGATQE